MAKPTRQQVLCFLLMSTNFGRQAEIRLYFKLSENFMRPILKDWFWFVHIVLGSLVNFELLTQFQVDHLSHPVMPSLIFLLY